MVATCAEDDELSEDPDVDHASNRSVSSSDSSESDERDSEPDDLADEILHLS